MFIDVSCTNYIITNSQNKIVKLEFCFYCVCTLCKPFPRKQLKINVNKLIFELCGLNDSLNYCGFYYEEICFDFWFVNPYKVNKKINTSSGDQTAKTWRHSKRHGDGFAGLGGDSTYQKAGLMAVLRLIPPPVYCSTTHLIKFEV